MKLERIQLHGFLSHADTDWSPNGARLVTLVGANGAGKSSLLDAIAYALFDAARARTDDLVQLGATDMTALVEFEFSGSRYRVTRGRTTRSGGKSYLELAIAVGDAWRPLTGDTIRDTEARIRELLRMDASTFATAALLMQGRANAFAEATAAERKRILSQVLGLDVWERASARAREQAWELDTRIGADRSRLEQISPRLAGRPGLEDLLRETTELRAGIEAELAAKGDVLAPLERRLVELAAQLAAVDGIAGDIERLEAERSGLQERYRRIRERHQAAETAIAQSERVLARAAEVDVARAAIPGAQEAVEHLERQAAGVADLEEQLRGQRDRIEADRLGYERELATWTADFTAARRHVDSLAAAVNGDPVACEVCGYHHELVQADVSAHLAAARKRYAALEGSRPKDPPGLAREQAAITRLEGKIADKRVDPAALAAARQTLASLDRSAAGAEAIDLAIARKADEQLALARADEDLAAVEAEGTEKARAIAVAQLRLAEAGPLRQSKAATEAAISETKSLRTILEADLRRVDGQLATAAAALEQLDALAVEHDELAEILNRSTSDLRLLRRLVAAFGVGGIPARIIEGVLPELTRYGQEVLGELRPGMELAIHAQRARKDGTGVVEALDLAVRDVAGERPLALFSGGERMSVSLAIAVGLSRLVARRAGTAIRTLIVDEPDGLDAEARRAFGGALRILAHHGELERVVLVSHHEDLADVGDAVYQVAKNGKGSVVTQVV